MSPLESIKKILVDHVCKASKSESETYEITPDFLHEIYSAFFKLISDTTQSPESIVHLIEKLTSEIEGFSAFKNIHSLIAFACFHGLVNRRPDVLDGQWEALVWVIVKYSYPLGSFITDLPWTSPKIKTLEFITEFCSPELCPNPSLRLELLRFIRVFNCKDVVHDPDSFPENVINILCESCDKYISLDIDQVLNVYALDLHYVMGQFNINFRYIMDNYDIEKICSEIMPAVLKLSKKFALLGKEKQESFESTAVGREIWFDSLEYHMVACLSFCGLIPGYFEADHKKSLEGVICAVGVDSLLQNYCIDILDIITKVSNSFPDNDTLQENLIYMTDKLFNGFTKTHIKTFPYFQYYHEMDGGVDPAEEYRLRYFQKKISRDYNESDCDSEDTSSVDTSSDIRSSDTELEAISD